MAQKLGEAARFISAEEKESEAWKALIFSEKLPCRILVTTTVLDCGMNIHDTNLRHVAVLFEDRTTLLQAMGRKRCEMGEDFTLYIQSPYRRRLNWLIEENEKLLRVVDRVNLTSSGDNRQLFAELWHQGTQSMTAMVLTPYNGQLRLNNVAVHKVRRQAYYYRQLSLLMDEQRETAFPRLVHQWLGQKNGYKEENWLEYDDVQGKNQKLR